MSIFYCLNCAKKLNQIPKTIVQSLDLFDTPNKLAKFEKHTNTSSPSGFTHSVLFNTTTVNYREQVINAVNSGFLEINSNNEKNFIAVTSVDNGFSIRQGKSNKPTNAFKVVQLDDPNKTHGFPINKSTLICNICKNCGKPLF